MDTDWRDQNGDGVNDGSVQLGCEIVLAMMFAYAAMLELSELFGAIWDEGHLIRGVYLHFSSFWNIVDAANIGLQLMSVSVWISYQALQRSALSPLLRYDVSDRAAQPRSTFCRPGLRPIKRRLRLTWRRRATVWLVPLPPPRRSTAGNSTRTRAASRNSGRR